MITGTLAIVIVLLGPPLAFELSVYLTADKAQKMDMRKDFFRKFSIGCV